MKAILLIIVLIWCYLVKGQTSPYTGVYRDFSGNKLVVYADSNFQHSWNFDMQSSWARGKWTVLKDTLFFQMIPIFDTVRLTLINGTKDSLVLSLDETSERIIPETGALHAYGQNYFSYPGKLFFKANKLFYINTDGSLRKEKVRAFWTGKRVPAWFIKEE